MYIVVALRETGFCDNLYNECDVEIGGMFIVATP